MDLSQYILDRKIEGTLLASLQKLSEREKTAVETLLEALCPSANTLRELLGLASEIAARDGLSAGEVLSQPGITAECAREGVSRKEKQKNIRLALERVRYPHKRMLQDELSAKAKRVFEQTGVRFELPEEFEGEAVSLNVSAKSAEELATIGEKLKAAAQHPETAAIFAMLKGDY